MMQLQIESIQLPDRTSSCVMCEEQFFLRSARVFVHDQAAQVEGDICPDCLAQGAHVVWQKLLTLQSAHFVYPAKAYAVGLES